MITVVKAPAYLTVQDCGRTHGRAAGVPPGGAMDVFAISAANAMVGNDAGAAGLEWALGGGSIRFERDCAFALAGARVGASLDGKDVAPCTTAHARAGSTLSVEQFISGRFLYVAVSGGIDVPILMGSRSTYLPARFGGYEGRRLKSGDSIPLGPERSQRPEAGLHCAADLMPPYEGGIVHVTSGTHEKMFDEAAWRVFTESSYRVSASSDRTGYKLEGTRIGNPIGTLPSEAGCPGTIQVPGDGLPIALMADAPTVGGYPKIAVVSEADLPILAQRRPGESVRFELVGIEHSQRASRRRAADLRAISLLASRGART